MPRSTVQYNQFCGHYVSDGLFVYWIEMLDMIRQTGHMERGGERFIWTMSAHGTFEDVNLRDPF